MLEVYAKSCNAKTNRECGGDWLRCMNGLYSDRDNEICEVVNDGPGPLQLTRFNLNHNIAK